jgi:UDP-N-acetylmuramoyl-tripeptide--D-alanyl-D-alanine ligase
MSGLGHWDAERIALACGASASLVSAAAVSPSTSDRSDPTASCSPDASAGGPERVVIDSREAAPGALFVGLPGGRVDGGRFAAQALAAGAWGVLVSPDHAGAALDAESGGVVIAHPDPLAGLQALASSWLDELRAQGARVVAITGSTGKTSTKDILAALLAPALRTVRSPENFNTEIGLPLAVLAAPSGTEVIVVEMAMRGAGQIAELTRIARPEVGVIVNIGPVHLELLGSLEAIAAAKAELIAGLDAGATIVIPAEPLLQEHLREDLRTVTFGAGGEVSLAGRDGRTVHILDRIGRDEPPRVIDLEPSFGQAHQLENLLAAVAAARALGVTPTGSVDVAFSAHRGQLRAGRGGIVVIDDCYNANPMSVRAAIDELSASARGRRVAVLGDMLELGPRADAFHREIGAHASARGVELLLTVGPLAAAMAGGFAGESHAAPDAAGAVELLEELLRPGDTVLVKGSRGVGLERVVDALVPALPSGRHAVSAAAGRR